MAARLPGDGPADRAQPSLVKHRLHFEVRAETMALFRDLQATVRRDLGGRVDDDTLLYELARRALGGPDEAGRSSYQVALTRCAECGEASIDAAGQSHPVDRVVAEMPCDGQELGAVGSARGDGSHGSPSPQVGAEHEAREAELPRPAPELPRPAPASPQVGAEVAAATPGRRSSQTIPPAIRRAVLRRDRQRCVVDGCSNHLFLDVHHVDPRSEGGSHDPDRLVCLCGSHHRQAHAGRLCIDGSATAGFTFRHADGAPYGQPLRPVALELAQQALGALRLGFGRAAPALSSTHSPAGGGAPDDLGPSCAPRSGFVACRPHRVPQPPGAGHDAFTPRTFIDPRRSYGVPGASHTRRVRRHQTKRGRVLPRLLPARLLLRPHPSSGT